MSRVSLWLYRRTPPPIMSTSGRVNGLDGLRGYAALSVVIYHAILFPVAERASSLLEKPLSALSGYDLFARVILALTSGETAVMLFFVVSGFVLTKSLERDTAKFGLIRAVAVFPIKRMLRIFPALIVCLCAMYLLYKAIHLLFPGTYPDPQFTDAALNALLWEVRFHGASWTLKAEILAVPFILAAFLLRRLLGNFAHLISISYALLLLDIPSLGGGIWLLPSWLMYFVGGFIAYDLAATRAVATLVGGLWSVVVGFMVLLRPLVSMQSHIAVGIQLLCIVLVVAFVASHTQNSLTAFLSRDRSVFFGRISYSLYLWNVAILNVLLLPAVRVGWTKDHYVEAGCIIGLLTIAMTIPIAVLSERWVERPFVELFKGMPDQALFKSVMLRLQR